MTDVINWPPVGLTAWEITRHHPVSRSVALIDGRPRTSSAQRARRLASAEVAGIGPDLAGAAYVEMLKEFLEGGRHLVRIECRAPAWHLAQPLNLRNGVMAWEASGADLDWLSGNQAMPWSDNLAMHGAPATDKGWPALRVEGLPAGVIVARPGDRITVMDDQGASEASRAQTVARSNGQGVAKIRTRDAFTLSGLVSIGDPESIVFEVLGDLPRAVQPLGGDWSYSFALREVFPDEFPEAWVEVDPWG